jgi:hypothetical protein
MSSGEISTTVFVATAPLWLARTGRNHGGAAISEAVEARRKALRGNRLASAKRREPRSPDRQASLERRRRQASSGALPPALAANFTLGEAAALSVVAAQIRRHGRCAMFLDQVAALAGDSTTGCTAMMAAISPECV